MDAKDRLIVALDEFSFVSAKRLVKQLSPYVTYFKVGLEFATAVGVPHAVKLVRGFGCRTFLDCKFKGIPYTLGGATQAAAALNVAMVSIDASSGTKALRTAANRKGQALLFAATVLTSFNEQQCRFIYGASVKEKVLQFARIAEYAGCDGIICSPRELEYVSTLEFKHLLKMTPGIRPAWAPPDDQQRTMTPHEAIQAGADYLVVGRPITRPPKNIGGPQKAAQLIIEEINAVLKGH
ncbi:MAG: orotidine 5'-phosphate decarboxylase [Candidatus Terrybacteria bacterium RIFCSPLOWO2_01_FULL_48_14]|nr:MAG: orotidine 5'-phosphate decarboxylase [Candidatus Terrybacteria bacterium RIFCSPLOWO2_01_FULL_48_14]